MLIIIILLIILLIVIFYIIGCTSACFIDYFADCYIGCISASPPSAILVVMVLLGITFISDNIRRSWSSNGEDLRKALIVDLPCYRPRYLQQRQFIFHSVEVSGPVISQ